MMPKPASAKDSDDYCVGKPVTPATRGIHLVSEQILQRRGDLLIDVHMSPCCRLASR